MVTTAHRTGIGTPALALVAFIAIAGVADAQECRAIGCGETVEGVLPVPGAEQCFVFRAQRGEVVEISVRGAKGGFHPCWRLRNAAGAQIFPGSGCWQETRRFQFQATGSYTLIVTDDNRTEIGAYELSLEVMSATFDGKASCRDGTLVCGETFGGEIDAADAAATIGLNARAGDVVEIAVRGENGAFIPCWRLHDAAGTQIFPGSGCWVDKRRYTFPATGSFTLVVTDSDGVHTGPYELLMEAMSDTLNGSPSCRDATLGCGQTLQRSIIALAVAETIRLRARAEDVVEILVGGANGTFAPCWRLHDAAGTQIFPGSGCWTDGRRYKFPVTGAFTLVVTDDDGVHTGPYDLSLEAISATFNDAPSCRDGLLGCGDKVQRCFDSPRALHSFLFTARAQQQIKISVAGANGTFHPCWRLHNALGDQISPGTGCWQGTRTVEFGSDGLFSLIITDDDLTDTGCYEIALEGAGPGCQLPLCGDGTVTQPEQCEPQESPSRCAAGNVCRSCVCTVSSSTCGDGILDPGEQCDPGSNGGGPCCTSECRFAPTSVVCRPAAGVCDAAETCTGTAAACPADRFLPATTTCRAASDGCDAAETCSGTSPTCPPDRQRPFVCGDGRVCGTEECDPPGGSCGGGSLCDSSCQCVGVSCPTLTVGTVCSFGDGRVRVPVDLDPMGFSVGALNYTVEYRDAFAQGLVTLAACEPGESSETVAAEQSCEIDEPPGETVVFLATPSVVPVPALPAGPITALVFDVTGGRPGETIDVCIPPASVAFGGTDGKALCVGEPVCGAIKVVACERQGDCNCDGAVNSGDRVCLITKFFEPQLQGTCACEDCNLDGKLNAADAPCITLCSFGRCPAVDPQVCF
jgi:hypothetical protein